MIPSRASSSQSSTYASRTSLSAISSSNDSQPQIALPANYQRLNRHASLPASAFRPRSNSRRSRNSIFLPNHYKSKSAAWTSGSAWDIPEDTPKKLIPTLTIIAAQQSRIYIEGSLSVLKEGSKEGWVEGFGRLSGCDLSISSDALPKPIFANVVDITVKPYKNLTTSDNQLLSNVLCISTISTTRYYLLFDDEKTWERWHASLRLSSFENIKLSEAYTASLLATKGIMISDIKTILAGSRFLVKNWVNLRFGSGGGKWIHCFVIIEPSKSSIRSKKRKIGSFKIFKNEKEKKKDLIAEVKFIYSCSAMYPSSSVLIESSNLLKIEGDIICKDGTNHNVLEIMPDPHAAVPGYDTLIRFLLPLYDAFLLYGRPDHLDSSRTSESSLFFGLPQLPATEYLTVDDAVSVIARNGSSQGFDKWNRWEWFDALKAQLAAKMKKGWRGSGDLRSSFIGSLTHNQEYTGGDDGSDDLFLDSYGNVALRPGYSNNAIAAPEISYNNQTINLNRKNSKRQVSSPLAVEYSSSGSTLTTTTESNQSFRQTPSVNNFISSPIQNDVTADGNKISIPKRRKPENNPNINQGYSYDANYTYNEQQSEAQYIPDNGDANGYNNQQQLLNNVDDPSYSQEQTLPLRLGIQT